MSPLRGFQTLAQASIKLVESPFLKNELFLDLDLS